MRIMGLTTKVFPLTFALAVAPVPAIASDHGPAPAAHAEHVVTKKVDDSSPEAAASQDYSNLTLPAATEPVLPIRTPAIREEGVGATVAMSAREGKAIRSGELLTLGSKSMQIVDMNNTKIELAPFSVAEFAEDGTMKLLRGSAILQSRSSRSLRTAGAAVDFTGRVLASYDHKARSTSAFVLDGEARLVNAQDPDRSMRLGRFRGATLEIQGLVPQLVRQLDVPSVDSWMKGFAWSDESRREIVGQLPDDLNVAKAPAPEHLREAKLEDYFSSIETADENGQPDYYDKKFADPDTVVAEANSKKDPGGKALSPEEAALISLPTTKIELGFDMKRAKEKDKELAHLNPEHGEKLSRGLASVDKPKPAAHRAPVKKTEPQAKNGLEPEVNLVLARLKGVKQKDPVFSGATPGRSGASGGRSPASMGAPVVPDPVYDYSQNF